MADAYPDLGTLRRDVGQPVRPPGREPRDIQITNIGSAKPPGSPLR
jgi:hypothetical protein